MKSELKIIDWEQSLKIAGNKKDLATEIMSLLINNLKQDIITIQEAYHLQQYQEMLRLAHKLHGALCYCGLPRLKKVIEKIELDLKKNCVEKIPLLLSQLQLESELIFKHYAAMENLGTK